jgi:hypothetical protein
MTTWQAERFALEHQTDVIRVVSSLGDFSGLSAGVRFDPGQRRLCLRLLRGRQRCSIPVASISELAVASSTGGGVRAPESRDPV